MINISYFANILVFFFSFYFNNEKNWWLMFVTRSCNKQHFFCKSTFFLYNNVHPLQGPRATRGRGLLLAFPVHQPFIVRHLTKFYPNPFNSQFLAYSWLNQWLERKQNNLSKYVIFMRFSPLIFFLQRIKF